MANAIFLRMGQKQIPGFATFLTSAKNDEKDDANA